jgi:CTD small phosphatase-like protein 2
VRTVKDLYNSPSLDKVTEPFLGLLKKHTYTLVLDLDETLIHSNQADDKVLVRPGAKEFIKELTVCYEVVVFTAGIKEYADWALSFVDPDELIGYKLYREHATKKNGVYVKDISKLGRNLKRVIIVDNVVENFQFQSANGIFIKPWKGDMNDRELVKLLPVLKEIVRQNVSDVRIALRYYRDNQLRTMLSNVVYQ